MSLIKMKRIIYFIYFIYCMFWNYVIHVVRFMYLMHFLRHLNEFNLLITWIDYCHLPSMLLVSSCALWSLNPLTILLDVFRMHRCCPSSSKDQPQWSTISKYASRHCEQCSRFIWSNNVSLVVAEVINLVVVHVAACSSMFSYFIKSFEQSMQFELQQFLE